MMFAIGLLIWIAIGVAGAVLTRVFYRGPTTTAVLGVCLGIFGALVGGMLGVAAYVTHDPDPLRIGGLVGAVIGAALFSYIYHAVAHKFV